jgi:hypothetical protein
MKVDSGEVREILLSHFKFNLDHICLIVTLHENLQELLRIFIREINVSYKRCKENLNMHFISEISLQTVEIKRYYEYVYEPCSSITMNSREINKKQ